jgi:hypothetical protein
MATEKKIRIETGFAKDAEAPPSFTISVPMKSQGDPFATIRPRF